MGDYGRVWNFGDGGRCDECGGETMHWYIPGTYTVELTDAFGSGDTHSVSKSVTVAGNGLDLMPTPRSDLAADTVNGVIYALGEYAGGSWLGTVEAYDPVTNSWTTRAPMPWPRRRLAVAQVNGLIYAIGGRVWGGGRESDVGYVERYDPVTDTWR